MRLINHKIAWHNYFLEHDEETVILSREKLILQTLLISKPGQKVILTD